ncbi:hypothetical protein [Actinomadura chibensis]|uniref:Uncharacterized protein n=1 Tax=Actinomadura chibensis TaxID=392828 RepID=A0A5D0NQC7_9ACTN|nr:hypothetical protein [Actinomadura chibensis]TYB46281.1 hypothetical protein FXF69_13470 [Actinomadura chibensis]
MQSTKLARTVGVSALALTALATPAMADTPPAAPAPHTATVKKAGAETPSATTFSTRRMSKRCTRPRNKRFTVSYSPGSQSTTFYFNNHCSHKSYIKIKVHVPATGTVTKCIRVNARTHGRKKIWHLGGSVGRVRLAHC